MLGKFSLVFVFSVAKCPVSDLKEMLPEGYVQNYASNSKVFIEEVDAISEELKWL